jgi:hypothetical protein
MSGTFLVSQGVDTDASTAAVDPVAFTIANNLRIASLSVAAYECVTSLPVVDAAF